MRFVQRLGLAVTIVVSLLAAAVGGLAINADASIPHGSRAEVIMETGTKGPIGDPGYAIVRGWWGHEGGHHTGTSYFSLNAADSHGVVTYASVAALHQALLDGGSFSSLRVAFVPYSSNGSNERPLVHAGEPAGEAFAWWSDMGMGSGVGGSKSATADGAFVSTQQQWDKFWQAGRPVQAFDPHLVLHDVSSGAVSRTPEGTSILNTWPAGTKISVVLYVSSGYNKELEPLVKVGPDGHALTAWLTIRTIAQAGDPTASSAGYQVLTASKGEGAKLVDGLPPAGARYAPKSSDSATASSSPSPGASATSGPAAAQASQNGSSTAAKSNSGSAWTWVLVVLLVVLIGAGALAYLLRRRLASGGAA